MFPNLFNDEFAIIFPSESIIAEIPLFEDLIIFLLNSAALSFVKYKCW